MISKRMFGTVMVICLAVLLPKKNLVAQQAFVASGPTNFLPCRGEWLSQCNSATSWFETMGYSVDRLTWPTKQEVEEKIKDTKVELFYLAGHGDTVEIKLGCLEEEVPEYITVEDIEQWMENRPPIKFVFYAGCNGACQSGEGTMAYALTKGYQPDSAFFSFCGMDQEECIDCWNNFGFWRYDFFDALSQEKTVGQSFDLAMDQNSMCQDCIFLEGDPDLKLVETPEPSVCDNDILEEGEVCDYQGIVDKMICLDCLEEIEAQAPDYSNQADCEDAGFYWYDDACHSDPIEDPEPEVIYGDVSPKESFGDNKVNIFDLLQVIDFILTIEEPEDWQFKRADVPTGTPSIECLAPDEEINIFDLLVVINKILTRDNCIDIY